MSNFRQKAFLYILIYTSLNYLWIILWRDNRLMLVVGSNLFQLIAPLISFIGLFKAFSLKIDKKNRSFWLFLSLACLCTFIGQAIWTNYEVILRIKPPTPNFADFFWSIQYFFYLIAFLCRMYNLRQSFSTLYFFIDIMIIMVVSASVSWEFIIAPMLTAINANTFLSTFIYLGQPIGDLGMLFGALSLFLIADQNISRKAFTLIFIGLLINFFANSAFAYTVVSKIYVTGSFFDPLWSLSSLLIGLSGLYATESDLKILNNPVYHKIFKYRYFLPYLFISILLVLTIRKHYQIMEALTYGLAITIILLGARLILTLLSNDNLILKQQRLTNDLLEKNIQLENTNQLLSEKEQQLKDVFDNLDAVIWSMDLQKNTVMISTGVERIFGYSRELLEENPTLWKKYIYHEDFDKVAEFDLIQSPGKVMNPLVEFRVIQPNHTLKWVQVLRTPVYDASGRLVKIHAVLTDITELKKAEETIEYMAFHDQLTGLPNRSLFYQHLKQLMNQADQELFKVAILFIDLDRFKSINDTLGHHIGDLLLKAVSNRLKECLPDSSTISRMGGDEFTIVLRSNTKNDSTIISQKIIDYLGQPFSIEGHALFITPSIGISLYPDHGATEEELVIKADMAMYYAKNHGKNNYYIYTSGLDKSNARKVKIENALRRAIEINEFSIQYQPKVDLLTGKIIGTEALIRWSNSKLGNVSPMEFIPIAEDIGLISQIGEWVLKAACIQNKVWQTLISPAIPVSVNVSALQLNDGFVTTVSTVLKETKLDPQYLELEITESVMQNIKETSKILKELKQLGILLAIDDFGTGYSSLSYLKHLPVDYIKIDRSFINDILDDDNGGTIVKTILDMARNLNFKVIAEGIENIHQQLFLQQNHCLIGQGYLFSPPVPADKFLALLKKGSIHSELKE